METKVGYKENITLQVHTPLFYFRPLAFYRDGFYPSIFYVPSAYQNFLLHDGQDAYDAFYVPI